MEIVGIASDDVYQEVRDARQTVDFDNFRYCRQSFRNKFKLALGDLCDDICA